MRQFPELRQLATEERRLVRRPQLLECLDALLELTTGRPKAIAAKAIECPRCAGRREAKRVAQAKWRAKKT